MEQLIEFSSLSDTGLKRKKNEDRIVLGRHPDFNHLLLVGVIDGVGGYDGGDIAAELCKKTIEDVFDRNTKRFENEPKKALNHALFTANQAICSQKQTTGLEKMSCVASIGVINEKE
ncbi:MAG: hypothetical protein ACPGEC_06400, partial [Flavobacteriales bacterium]